MLVESTTLSTVAVEIKHGSSRVIRVTAVSVEDGIHDPLAHYVNYTDNQNTS